MQHAACKYGVQGQYRWNVKMNLNSQRKRPELGYSLCGVSGSMDRRVRLDFGPLEQIQWLAYANFPFWRHSLPLNPLKFMETFCGVICLMNPHPCAKFHLSATNAFIAIHLCRLHIVIYVPTYTQSVPIMRLAKLFFATRIKNWIWMANKWA